MYARVVRFTEADPERIAARDEEGPPEGVNPKSIQVVHDKSQNTAVVFFLFDSEEDMREADEALNAMDMGETPGSRASVDQGEIVMTIEPD
jgi:hypothetical protein